jgi:hypothetical protein
MQAYSFPDDNTVVDLGIHDYRPLEPWFAATLSSQQLRDVLMLSNGALNQRAYSDSARSGECHPSELARFENDVARLVRIAIFQALHDGSVTFVCRLPGAVTKQLSIPFPAEDHRFEQNRLSNAEAHVYS